MTGQKGQIVVEERRKILPEAKKSRPREHI
jgi:hypothetical protein